VVVLEWEESQRERNNVRMDGERKRVWFVGNTITYSKGGAPDILAGCLVVVGGFVGH
jgi:hypothetical protein